MAYIPRRSLDNLKRYTYNSVDKSILSKYLLNPFWNQFVKLWPKWVAPNTITATGLSLVGINFLTLLLLRPGYRTTKDGVDGLPSWAFFSWSIGLFLYQSLDAIDGKQARRTGMAGPLGEMFDHGCDAMNTTLEVILASYALNLGRSWWTVAMQIATLANFYLTTWEEFHTGQLFLGVFSGPVEGIIMVVVIFAISGLYGPSIWDTGILTMLRVDRINVLDRVLSKLNFPLNEAFMIFGGASLAFNIVTSYTNVYNHAKANRKPRFIPLLNLLPFVISTSTYLLWLAAPSPSSSPSRTFKFSPSSSAIVYSPLFVPFLCAWGLQFAHQVGRMILAHVTQERHMPWFGSDGGWVWVVSLGFALDANAGWLFGRSPVLLTSHITLTLAVFLMLAISLFSYARFCYIVINEITNHLGIACFTVRKRDEDGVWRSPDTISSKDASVKTAKGQAQAIGAQTGSNNKTRKRGPGKTGR